MEQAGGALGLGILLLGHLIYKKDAIGGADIKFPHKGNGNDYRASREYWVLPFSLTLEKVTRRCLFTACG